jgi:hypothetical protein
VWTKLSLGVTGIPSAHVVATVPALDRQVLEAPDGVEPLVNHSFADCALPLGYGALRLVYPALDPGTFSSMIRWPYAMPWTSASCSVS